MKRLAVILFMFALIRAASAQLPAGTELHFSASLRTRSASGSERDKREATAWVLSANPDRSRRILLLEYRTIRSVGPGSGYSSGALFDLDDAGTSHLISRFGELDPAFYFPQLPAGAATDIVIEPHDPVRTAQTLHEKRTYRIDPATRLIEWGEESDERSWPVHATTGGVISLDSVGHVDPAELSQLIRESQILFTATDAYRVAMLGASEDVGASDRAVEILRYADRQITHPKLTDAIAPLFTEHLMYASFDQEIAKAFSAMIGKPAPDFTAIDLAGKSHALSDYRGKVVVLDFWNRSCPPCMAEMPALIQMAKEYGDSVQFLGMFTTPELKNAKIVDAQLHFPYPILDGSKLLDTYHANSWPTLIIIDQQGILRHARVGGSEDPRTELALLIDPFLRAK